MSETQPGEKPESLIPAFAEVDGHRYPLAIDQCSRCANFWLRPDLPEFAPNMCPYCGLEFRFYTDGDGGPRRLNGRPL
jgi:hypothetical protein